MYSRSSVHGSPRHRSHFLLLAWIFRRLLSRSAFRMYVRRLERTSLGKGTACPSKRAGSFTICSSALDLIRFLSVSSSTQSGRNRGGLICILSFAEHSVVEHRKQVRSCQSLKPSILDALSALKRGRDISGWYLK